MEKVHANIGGWLKAVKSLCISSPTMDIEEKYMIHELEQRQGREMSISRSGILDLIREITAEIQENNHYSRIARRLASQIELPVEIQEEKNCECGTMADAEAPMLMCGICGLMPAVNDVISVDQFSRNPRLHEHSRYQRLWINRIQARENVEIPKEHLDTIKADIAKYGYSSQPYIYCEQIRGLLKINKLTKYNHNVPFIRKLLTGYEPPQLTSEELCVISSLFMRAMEIFDQVKSAEKSNAPYYPYILYKIIEQELGINARTLKILECIHLQSRDTVIVNDRIWERMSNHCPIFKYKPTTRSTVNIY